MMVALPQLRPACPLFGSPVEGEAHVVNLARALELPPSTISSHLACPFDRALVDGRVEGPQVFSTNPSPARSEPLELQTSAKALPTATSERAASCPRHGGPT